MGIKEKPLLHGFSWSFFFIIYPLKVLFRPPNRIRCRFIIGGVHSLPVNRVGFVVFSIGVYRLTVVGINGKEDATGHS